MTTCYAEEAASTKNLIHAPQVVRQFVIVSQKGVQREFADNQVRFSHFPHLQSNKPSVLPQSLVLGETLITIWVQQQPRKIMGQQMKYPQAASLYHRWPFSFFFLGGGGCGVCVAGRDIHVSMECYTEVQDADRLYRGSSYSFFFF